MIDMDIDHEASFSNFGVSDFPFGGFPTTEDIQNGWFNGKSHLEMDDWAYPYDSGNLHLFIINGLVEGKIYRKLLIFPLHMGFSHFQWIQ